jgi:hypothetical protein
MILGEISNSTLRMGDPMAFVRSLDTCERTAE